LSPVRCSGRVRGRPRRPGRATRTWSTSPTSWVVSASWPGVRQVARCDPGRRRWYGAWWSAHPVTAPAPPAGLPGSSRAPFPGPSGVLVGPDHRGVNVGVPVQLPSTLGLGAQGGLDPSPGPVGLPAREPFVDRLPGPLPLGQIPPGHPATHPNQAAVEDLTVVPPTPTPPRRHRWQQRRQPLPFFVGDLEAPVHGQLLPHQLHPTKLTHRSKKHTLGRRFGSQWSAWTSLTCGRAGSRCRGASWTVALPPPQRGRTQEHLTSRSSERRILRFRLLRGTDGQGRPQRSRHGALLRVALRAVEPSGAGPWATRRFPQAKRGTRAVETVAMDGTVEAGGRVLDGYVLPFRVPGSPLCMLPSPPPWPWGWWPCCGGCSRSSLRSRLGRGCMIGRHGRTRLRRARLSR
jgi:hypothetical protein